MKIRVCRKWGIDKYYSFISFVVNNVNNTYFSSKEYYCGLSVVLSFFLWPLYCLPFSDLRLLIITCRHGFSFMSWWTLWFSRKKDVRFVFTFQTFHKKIDKNIENCAGSLFIWITNIIHVERLVSYLFDSYP